MTPPRRRGLSDEERRLWAEVVRSVRPFAGRVVEPGPDPVRSADPVAPKLGPARKPAPAACPAAAAAAPRPRLAPLAEIERGTMRALGRGRAAPDAVLDLHGLTQPAAHARLASFLHAAAASGHALVLVVTGRGREDGSERGVLRRVVPHWLEAAELRPVVLGFGTAGPRQGGTGALYVRLRRRRPA